MDEYQSTCPPSGETEEIPEFSPEKPEFIFFEKYQPEEPEELTGKKFVLKADYIPAKDKL